jgi:hypothetical protein
MVKVLLQTPQKIPSVLKAVLGQTVAGWFSFSLWQLMQA